MSSGSESPPPDAKPLSLRRWSQRKREAARAAAKRSDALPAAAGAAPPSATPAAVGSTLPAATGTHSASAPLPPVESLTPDSDFTAFFNPKTGVDEILKRAALKQLLRDPRFNVMDGLDTYIDDYTREDPIPESVLKRLVQSRAFRDPNPEEQAEEQAQRDAALTPAQDGTAMPPPQTAGTPTLPVDVTPPASSRAVDAAPDVLPPKKP
jgi:hypothetical protein